MADGTFKDEEITLDDGADMKLPEAALDSAALHEAVDAHRADSHEENPSAEPCPDPLPGVRVYVTATCGYCRIAPQIVAPDGVSHRHWLDTGAHRDIAAVMLNAGCRHF